MEFRYKHWCGRAERGRTRAPPCRRYSGGTVTARADQLWHAETGPPDQIWRRTNYCVTVLLVDAKNAFNSLNRAAALHNCQVLCPSLAPILINIYRSNAELFVAGESILSQEGTTQGDPLAMAMYALGTLPLIRAVTTPGVKQTWYADDAAAGGNLRHIRQWWNRLAAVGPDFGYFANSSKSWLVVKEQHLAEAERVFAETGLRITCEGKRHLGAALGTRDFVVDYVQEKVANWKAEIGHLSSFAKSEPHAAYMLPSPMVS